MNTAEMERAGPDGAPTLAERLASAAGGVAAFTRQGASWATAWADAVWMRASWMLPGPANEREIRVIAMRRSGHHAVVNWIRLHLPGRHCFLNECLPNANPFESCARSVCRVWTGRVQHRRIFWDQEIAGRHSKKGILLYNFEDERLEDVASARFEANRARWLGESRERTDVLVLRDPFNLLASKLRWAYGRHAQPALEEFPGLVVLWKQHAREFLGETQCLGAGTVGINYNRWFTDAGYRRELVRKLGLVGDGDRGLQQVARFGPTLWGDTFDGMKYDGRAQQMKVLERWHTYRDDPLYRSLFRDPELIELSERIFGRIPGTETLFAPG
ncbi:MAG TPA: hypothetical protein VGR37_07395 [Longimicrobiaceae bacterium]|nr:hypothetical protein [Longimicrobiaceae bacterium]